MSADTAPNTRLTYLYRDGSNYKRWGNIVFAEACTEAVRHRLVNSLENREWFIARQVRVPEQFFDDQIDADDHCWHELSDLEPTDDPVNDRFDRTFEDFVHEVERACATGWNVYDRSAG
jgi:hypothetical protein